MDDDEETLCRYGTALPAFEEDAVPSKKPITVEDQIVLDSNGKRRFHGAFTGGFSAGYWNTVGSEEGWKPAEFKSSRREKSSLARQQNPMDFMDEEDLGEFGIAPQRVQAKDDFAHSNATGGRSANKRRLELAFSKGPIPGQPVLRALLEPAKEKTAVKILKKMGWREGQGIGERQTKEEKKQAKARNSKEQYVLKMYGCEISGREGQGAVAENDDTDSSDSSDYEITFAPDDFDPLVAALKDNTFGLGYSGLDRGGSSKAFQLFDTLEVVDRNNKKLSIRGQAFGIGALEEDDDLDVYARDDMSRYDFSLEDRSQPKKALEGKKSGSEANTLEGFCPASNSRKLAKKVFRVDVPEGFRPRNWEERRSRFDPIDEERAKKIQQENEYKIKGLGRHDLDPKERGAILGEKEIAKNPVLGMINKQSCNFVSREVINEEKNAAQEPVRPVKDEKIEAQSNSPSIVPSGLVQQPSVLQRQYVGSSKEGFKPFIAMPEKQYRYERFLGFQPTERYLTREQYLESLQPLNLSAWERERELKEFIQAERMYRPLDGLMSERFVTASSLIADNVIPPDGETGKPIEIRMKRTRVMWKPHKDICKRFNVPEPFGGMMVDDTDTVEKRRKEKGKFSVFDYLEAPVTNRRDFVTPSVIPIKQPLAEEKQPPVASSNKPVDQPGDSKTAGQRFSSKDFFLNDSSLSTAEPDRNNGATIEQMKPQTSRPAPVKRPDKKRTELEEKVLEATNKKPEEKRDLFKSIFCSSDEEEEGEEQQKSGGQVVPPPPSGQAALTDEEKLKMVDCFVSIKPASQLNILRNNSPPRGIFKNLFEFKKPQNGKEEPKREAVLQCSSKTVGKEKEIISVGDDGKERTDSSSDSDPDSASDSDGTEYYGPKLPSSKKGPSDAPPSTTQETGANPLLGGRETAAEKYTEIWIEKDDRHSSSSKAKKKKKHKHHQHKSKSKGKHKKDKKKSSHKHKSKR